MRGRDDPGLGTRVQLPDLRGRPAGAHGPARTPGRARACGSCFTIEDVTGLVIWLIAAVLLAIGELVTPGMFFLGPVALAAVGAAVTAGRRGWSDPAAGRLHRGLARV